MTEAELLDALEGMVRMYCSDDGDEFCIYAETPTTCDAVRLLARAGRCEVTKDPGTWLRALWVESELARLEGQQ